VYRPIVTGLDAAVARFRAHLAVTLGAAAVERFDRHHDSVPEATRAEAAIFDALASEELSPVAADDPSTGGVDIQCSLRGTPFAVEITSLGSDKIESRCVKEQTAGGFNLDTEEFLSLVRSRVSFKGSSTQATSSSGPRVLVIVASHWLAPVFMRVAAAELLTGQVGRAWPVGPAGPAGESYPFTEFKNAAHLRWDPKHKVGTFRPRDALILLAALDQEKVQLVGTQNPKPGNELPDGAFSSVPTTRLVAGIGESSLHLAWSLENHEPYCDSFRIAP
jgi:hypothetical protein